MRKNKKKKGNTEIEDVEENFEDLQDKVEFGERVDAPPSIKLSKFTPSNHPGSKKMLLHKTLNNSVTKKKSKSMAQKQAIEKERQKAVELYRQLKASKG